VATERKPMMRFFQSLFPPVIVIALVGWLAFGKTSIPSFFGAILPFLLLIGFWIFLSQQVRNRKKNARVSDTAGVGHVSAMADPESESKKQFEKRIGLGN
jgi:hypothetical protein